MKVSALFPSLFVMTFLGVAHAADAPQARRYVLTAPENSANAGASVHRVRQSLVNGAIRGFSSIDADLHYYQGFVFTAEPAAVEEIRRRYGDQLRIEEDVEVTAADAVAVSPASGMDRVPGVQTLPWGVELIQAPAAFGKSRGKDVVVCVADTGVQADHPDLAGNVVGGESLLEGANREDWRDDNGHGTHVAGTIAALDNGIGVVGVAPEAKIFSAKVLNGGGTGSLASLAEGVRSCVAHGAKVINMSLAVPSRPALLEQAVRDAGRAGVILVAAAGNWHSEVAYPAKFPEVIAVSAIGAERRLISISNFGPEIRFAAPGEGVVSTTLGGGYGKMTGTSMAAPHVAGVAALMLAARSSELRGVDLGLPREQQGLGLINALVTVR